MNKPIPKTIDELNYFTDVIDEYCFSSCLNDNNGEACMSCHVRLMTERLDGYNLVKQLKNQTD